MCCASDSESRPQSSLCRDFRRPIAKLFFFLGKLCVIFDVFVVIKGGRRKEKENNNQFIDMESNENEFGNFRLCVVKILLFLVSCEMSAEKLPSRAFIVSLKAYCKVCFLFSFEEFFFRCFCAALKAPWKCFCPFSKEFLRFLLPSFNVILRASTSGCFFTSSPLITSFPRLNKREFWSFMKIFSFPDKGNCQKIVRKKKKSLELSLNFW